jgi:hypothetical protein
MRVVVVHELMDDEMTRSLRCPDGIGFKRLRGETTSQTNESDIDVNQRS